MRSFQHFLEPFIQRLQEAQIDNPAREVRLLVAWIARQSYAAILLNPPKLTPSEVGTLEQAIERRRRHEPLTKIMGRASFWKQTFLTTQDTLDPRPESELFPETLLRFFPENQRSLRLLDLGTGTGCLLLSCLLEYPQATGLGVDISPLALSVARRNAAQLGLTTAVFQQSDWFQNVSGDFDVILCNPPYIRENERLEADTLFDPPLALFGGADGLAAYRALLPACPAFLKREGVLFLELGIGQKDAVIKLARAAGLEWVETEHDIQGIPRLLVFRAAELYGLS